VSGQSEEELSDACTRTLMLRNPWPRWENHFKIDRQNNCE
jgi:hypothetical protein